MEIIRWIAGYSISIIAGHFIVRGSVEFLWNKVKEEWPNQEPKRSVKSIMTIHGCMERFIFTSAIALGVYEGIWVWLAFKVVTRWRVGSDDEKKIIPSSALIYLIGTGLNLTIGVVGGLIAIGKYSLG